MVERGLAAQTLEAYRRDLDRYAATLAARGRTAIGDVTTQDVAAFLAGLRAGDACREFSRARGSRRARAACIRCRGGADRGGPGPAGPAARTAQAAAEGHLRGER